MPDGGHAEHGPAAAGEGWGHPQPAKTTEFRPAPSQGDESETAAMARVANPIPGMRRLDCPK